MSAPTGLLVLPPDVRQASAWTSAGCPAPNLTLWAACGIPWTWYRSISGLRPEMGMKMAGKWILASTKKLRRIGPENAKNGPKNGKMARKWFENGIPRHVSPIFQVRPKSIFRPFPSPFWICTRSTGFQGCIFLFLRKGNGSPHEGTDDPVRRKRNTPPLGGNGRPF